MPHTILYVEDESAIIELVHDVLLHPDITLISAASGAEGLRKAREAKPDLLILDVIMPDRSGWSLYEELRQDEAFKDVPIIMLTGILHKYRIMKEFSKSSVDAYITKPFDASTLRLEIEKMLRVTLWSKPERKSHQPPAKPGKGTCREKAVPAAKKKTSGQNAKASSGS